MLSREQYTRLCEYPHLDSTHQDTSGSHQSIGGFQPAALRRVREQGWLPGWFGGWGSNHCDTSCIRCCMLSSLHTPGPLAVQPSSTRPGPQGSSTVVQYLPRSISEPASSQLGMEMTSVTQNDAKSATSQLRSFLSVGVKSA